MHFLIGTAGRSAEATYETVAKAWRRRLFGARASLYFWILFAAALITVVSARLSGQWALYAGFGLGAAAVAWMLLPDAVMPHQVFKWQLGAWGEQKTARELKRLVREGWVVRHDVAWGRRANHDHVVAGPAVYLLNSKNVPASRVSVDGVVLRVSALDNPSDSYLADRWLPASAREARALEQRLKTELGFGVAVYPVVVVWGEFPQQQLYVNDVCVIGGNQLLTWLRSRPADLLNLEKRRRVHDWVASLPQRQPRRRSLST